MLTVRESKPQHLDALGALCLRGSSVASYLFQMPSDDNQAGEIRQILREIIGVCEKSSHTELPRIAHELLAAADGLPSIAAADELVAGFDRIVKLWEASRSGLF